MEHTIAPKPHVHFEIEKIIGISADGNYQVQWAPAWVSKYHLVGCQHLIQEFLQQTTEKTSQCQQRAEKTLQCQNNSSEKQQEIVPVVQVGMPPESVVDLNETESQMQGFTDEASLSNVIEGEVHAIPAQMHHDEHPSESLFCYRSTDTSFCHSYDKYNDNDIQDISTNVNIKVEAENDGSAETLSTVLLIGSHPANSVLLHEDQCNTETSVIAPFMSPYSEEAWEEPQINTRLAPKTKKKKIPMTPAERQRKYRQSKKMNAQTAPNTKITKNTKKKPMTPAERQRKSRDERKMNTSLGAKSRKIAMTAAERQRKYRLSKMSKMNEKELAEFKRKESERRVACRKRKIDGMSVEEQMKLKAEECERKKRQADDQDQVFILDEEAGADNAYALWGIEQCNLQNEERANNVYSDDTPPDISTELNSFEGLENNDIPADISNHLHQHTQSVSACEDSCDVLVEELAP